MKTRLITLSAACVALFATVSIGQAQDPAAKNNDRPNRWHHKRGNPVEHLTTALDLTPEQQAKVKAIFEQAKPQIQAIRESVQAQIRPILTPAQQQKWDAIKKARHDMRKARQEMRDALEGQ
jgi:Spy/CpxP family protein refolding chaperone